MDLKRLIFLGYCRTKHARKTQIQTKKFGKTKVCKAKEVKKCFANPKLEHEVFG